MPHLVGIEGLAAGAMFVLSAPVTTLGRDAENDIALMDRALSLFHARLTITEAGPVRVSAESETVLVLVNNKPITHAVLAPGDLLQIGDSVFRFEA